MDHKYNRILKLYESSILGIRKTGAELFEAWVVRNPLPKAKTSHKTTAKSKAWMTAMFKEYEKMGGKRSDMDWDTAYYHFNNQMDAKEAAKKLMKK